ncbi:hypothetical protein K8I31_12195 [bacterium]|nr:hypothetical protein [bacterium]
MMFAEKRRFDMVIELAAFILIAAFCLGAWITRPERIFSLRETISNHTTAEDEFTSVTLPPSWSKHFGGERIDAYRLTNNDPLFMNRTRDGANINIKEEGSYFFYALALNQRPSQFSLAFGNTNFKTRSMSDLIPNGAAIWRDQFFDIGDIEETSTMKISAINPEAKSYLCEFAVFQASGLDLWR